ncbi:UvrD-helicase domain-containing protein [Candidatus Solincola sp.]
MKFPEGHGTRAEVSPPDVEARSLIVTALDRNLLVEAAAGTGKTSAMIARMLALLRSGSCRHVRHLAAVTFTRKAAAEIRVRFLSALEQAWREAEDGKERERLERALEEAEQCFIGTIHSFCARILRERPLEAGLGLEFREIDDLEDRLLREEAWREFSNRLFLGDDRGLLARLEEKGLQLSDLESAFLSYADFPDVEEWPRPEDVVDLAMLERVREGLRDYLRHVEELAPYLPRDAERDTLIPLLRRLPRVISHYRLEEPAELMEALEHLDRSVSIVQRVWRERAGLSGEKAKEEKERWESFRDEVVRPALSRWRESRYALCLEVLEAARGVYDEMRRERKLLNFQDLLVEAARLLRENPAARKELQGRFTHLLVDEFQDTDPVQAEIIFLLVSTDPEERDWRKCVPRPGSLFLVGDPKQSIYRFRRADISIYNEVKELVQRGGGHVLNLAANFRSLPEITHWVNSVFSPQGGGDPDTDEAGGFPSRATEFSPAYVELFPALPEVPEDGFRGIYRLTIPGEHGRTEEALPYLADRIARFIAGACSGGLKVLRRTGKEPFWSCGPAEPSDFLVLTYQKGDLAVIAEKLQEHGVPCRVSGGESLNRVPELRLLHLCLRAVLRPYDSLALLAVLRSELFGFSDAQLYAFKKAGGVFSYLASLPSTLDPELRELFGDAFDRLGEYRRWFHRLPLLSALERMVDDLGLPVSAALRPGGDVQAGSLAKALEVLREAEEETWTTSRLLDRLGRLAENRESYDGISALSEEPPAVRVMNLHKAKGLEAPVVFLAGVRGGGSTRVERHVDRSPAGTRGYLAILRDISSYKRQVLAHPAGWEELEAREQRFLEAEALRLRYVAATRASSAIVITVRERNDANHPWRHFAPHLEEAPELPDLSSPEGKEESSPKYQVPRVEEFVLSSAARRESFLRPTYQVFAAGGLARTPQGGILPETGKMEAWLELEESPRSPSPPGDTILSGQERTRADCQAPLDTPPSPASGNAPSESGVRHPPFSRGSPDPSGGKGRGEEMRTRDTVGESSQNGEPGEDVHGPDFGEVVHLLLQAAAEGPPEGLPTLATALLEERDLAPELAPEALRLVERVRSSSLWARALASRQRLVEVPFHYLEEKAFPLPTLIRGVVDLAFREEDGWVLVDYKTDREASRDPLRTARRYLPQVRLYASAWERMLGERVKEAFIYLLEPDLVYRLRPVADGRGAG